MEMNYEARLAEQHQNKVNAHLIDDTAVYDIYKIKEKRKNINGMPSAGRVFSGPVEVHGHADACWLSSINDGKHFRSSMILNVTKEYDVVTVETANSIYELRPYKEINV